MRMKYYSTVNEQLLSHSHLCIAISTITPFHSSIKHFFLLLLLYTFFKQPILQSHFCVLQTNSSFCYYSMHFLASSYVCFYNSTRHIISNKGHFCHHNIICFEQANISATVILHPLIKQPDLPSSRSHRQWPSRSP